MPPPPTHAEIREADAVWQLGAPALGRTIAVSGPEGPAEMRFGPDGRMWLTLNKGLAAVTSTGSVTHYPPPVGDRIDSFGFVGSSVLCFLRKARKVEFRNLAGQPDGRSFPLSAQMKFPRFDPGPDGTVWISSLRAAKVIWVRPDGSRGSAEEMSSPGYALTDDGLMWGLSGGLFSLDSQGFLRDRIYVSDGTNSVIGDPVATNDGGLWFIDSPGPAEEAPHRINRYDRPANLLQRWRLPPGHVPFALCPWPGGGVAFAAHDGSVASVGTFSDGIANARNVGAAQLLTSIALTSDGRLWSADTPGKRIIDLAL